MTIDASLDQVIERIRITSEAYVEICGSLTATFELSLIFDIRIGVLVLYFVFIRAYSSLALGAQVRHSRA